MSSDMQNVNIWVPALCGEAAAGTGALRGRASLMQVPVKAPGEAAEMGQVLRCPPPTQEMQMMF